MDETKKYTVVEPVTIADVQHEAGAEIELTDEQVAALPEGSVKLSEAQEAE